MLVMIFLFCLLSFGFWILFSFYLGFFFLIVFACFMVSGFILMAIRFTLVVARIFHQDVYHFSWLSWLLVLISSVVVKAYFEFKS